jgi:hypothetical protein
MRRQARTWDLSTAPAQPHRGFRPANEMPNGTLAALAPARDVLPFQVPEVLVGRGRIELPQSKTRVLQTLGLTTCPTDPRATRTISATLGHLRERAP